jgi:hypothetical protein
MLLRLTEMQARPFTNYTQLTIGQKSWGKKPLEFWSFRKS